MMHQSPVQRPLTLQNQNETAHENRQNHMQNPERLHFNRSPPRYPPRYSETNSRNSPNALQPSHVTRTPHNRFKQEPDDFPLTDEEENDDNNIIRGKRKILTKRTSNNTYSITQSTHPDNMNIEEEDNDTQLSKNLKTLRSPIKPRPMVTPSYYSGNASNLSTADHHLLAFMQQQSQLQQQNLEMMANLVQQNLGFDNKYILSDIPIFGNSGWL